MSKLKERVTFIASALLYILVNLKWYGASVVDNLVATGVQMLSLAPYIIGMTIIIVALIQHSAGGLKMPWERRIRIFFALGIMAGLINGIYQYAGQVPVGQ